MVKHHKHQRRYYHDAFSSGEHNWTRYVGHNIATYRQQCVAVGKVSVRFQFLFYELKQFKSRSVLMATAEPNKSATQTHFPGSKCHGL